MLQLRRDRIAWISKKDYFSNANCGSFGVSRFSTVSSRTVHLKPNTNNVKRLEGLRSAKRKSDVPERPIYHCIQLHALVPAEGEKQISAEEDIEPEIFSWFKNWWPVQAVDNLKTDRPNKVKLLSKDFIVWKSHSGKWIAMDDECSHRMAPLSEGRIEKDGNLLCSYHAWRFNEGGKCVKIPHAEDAKAHTIACNSPRSAVKTYPCQARGALLWIWPDDSPTAESDSATISLPIEESVLDNIEMECEAGVSFPYVRYFPYNYDVLMENVSDPAHFSVSHHKATPRHCRYKLIPMRALLFEGIGEISPINAMKYMAGSHPGKLGIMEHRHPGIVFSALQDQTTEKLYGLFLFFQVPVCLGQSLFIGVGGRNSALLDPTPPNLQTRILRKALCWINHVFFYNKVVDGDVVLLQHQDRKLREKGFLSNASRKYFTPTSADLLSMAFRKWFETVGGYGAEYGADQSYKAKVAMTKEQLLNRYEQHTKYCKVCSGALETIKKTVSVLKAASVFALITGTTVLLKQSTQSAFDLLSILQSRGIVVSMFCFALCFALAFLVEKKLVPLFYFVDFSHADNH